MIASIAALTTGRDRARFLREPERRVFVRPFVHGETLPPDPAPDGLPVPVVIVYRYGDGQMIQAPVWVCELPPDDESTAWDMLWTWATQQRLPGFEGKRP